jgi:hypothetical protein
MKANFRVILLLVIEVEKGRMGEKIENETMNTSLWCVCYLTLGVTLEISKGLDLRKSNTC